MPGKVQVPVKCGICKDEVSKYRCSACPFRYCSVACYKQHKAESCNPGAAVQQPQQVEVVSSDPDISLPSTEFALAKDVVNVSPKELPSLKPLTSLLWPPEPDPSIFTDPLRREDPKPLRKEELLRIATSPQLRHLLTATSLPHILQILDTLPTPHARSSYLARLLGLDPASLAKPAANPLLCQRDSPPPLGELLQSLVGDDQETDRGWDEDGWWLGREGTKAGRVWIGEEERKVVKLFAGVVCSAIDGGDRDDVGWGDGGLSWEV